MRKIDITLFPLDGDSEDIVRERELPSEEIVELAKVFAEAYGNQHEMTWMFFEYNEKGIRAIVSTNYYGELEFAEDLQMEVFGEIKYGFPVD